MSICVTPTGIAASSADATRWSANPIGGAPRTAATATAVLRISGMPVRLRPVVEDLMARVIVSESEFVVPGDDPLTAQWCTRWHKDHPGDNIVALAAGRATGTACGVGCRQVLTGTRAELEDFAAQLAQLAHAHGFSAQLEGVEDVSG